VKWRNIEQRSFAVKRVVGLYSFPWKIEKQNNLFVVTKTGARHIVVVVGR